MDSVLRELNKQASKIQRGSLDGLVEAGLFVKNRALPQTPIDLGNLRSSGYVVWSKGEKGSSGDFNGDPKLVSKLARNHATSKIQNQAAVTGNSKPSVRIGFSAFYAGFVHEINKNYNVGNWKYLQNVLEQDGKKILAIIQKRAKV